MSNTRGARWKSTLALISVLALLGQLSACSSPTGVVEEARKVPAPFSDDPSGDELQTAILAGGCFWSVEAVFEHVNGVQEVVTGYSGGTAETAQYDLVVNHRTDHAEVVRVTFDPSEVTYGQLLQVFFSVVHDPTQIDRQGPDVGRAYRSHIFYLDGVQRDVALSYIDQLEAAGTFDDPIATLVDPYFAFHPAEEEHQNFVRNNPDDDYVVLHSLPKLSRLRALFPGLYAVS